MILEDVWEYLAWRRRFQGTKHLAKCPWKGNWTGLGWPPWDRNGINTQVLTFRQRGDCPAAVLPGLGEPRACAGEARLGSPMAATPRKWCQPWKGPAEVAENVYLWVSSCSGGAGWGESVTMSQHQGLRPSPFGGNDGCVRDEEAGRGKLCLSLPPVNRRASCLVGEGGTGCCLRQINTSLWTWIVCLRVSACLLSYWPP